MAKALVNAPQTAKRGGIIEIRATIGHPMETGFRPGDSGQLLARDIITHFSCRYNGALVFSAELFSAMAANPYIAFFTTAKDSGTLVLTWEGDNGFSQTETVALMVTA